MPVEEDRYEVRETCANREAQTPDQHWAEKEQMVKEAIREIETISGNDDR